MIQKKKKSKSIFHILISCIYIMIFFYASAQILYWQYGQLEFLQRIYMYSQIVIFVLDCIYIMFHIVAVRNFRPFYIIVILFLLYETIVSYFTFFYGFLAFLRDAYAWPLTFVVFYMYARSYETVVYQRSLRRITVVGTSICMLLLVNNIRIHLSYTSDPTAGGMIGPVYFSLSFLGLILYFGTKKEKLFFSLMTVLEITFSAKRTGFLIVIFGLLLYYFIAAHNEKKLTKRAKQYALFAGLAVILLIVTYFAMNNFDLQIFTRLLNATDDGGSGRLQIWDEVISGFSDSGILNKLFGHGFHAVPVQILPLGRQIYSHNSYLETLYDLGVIGLIWLAGIVLYLCAKLIYMTGKKHNSSPALAYSMVEILLLSFLGYFFEEARFVLPVAVLWGLALGNFAQKNKSVTLRLQ